MSQLINFINFFFTIRFWLTIFLVLLWRVIMRMYLLRRKMPPGPMPWPILGNFPIFMKSKLLMHDVCLELSRKYGDPMTIFLATNPCVIITKYDLAKEILTQTNFSNRVESPVTDTLFEGVRDMSFGPYDSMCQLMRKITSKGMRTLIDAETLENQVSWATNFSIDQMLQSKPSVQPKQHMRNLIYNIIIAFATGKTFKIDDPQFISFLETQERANKTFSKAMAFDFLPMAKYLPLKYIPIIKQAMENAKVFKDYIKEQVKEHRQTFQLGHIRDFCDALLQEQIQLANEGGQVISDAELDGIIFDVYMAGTETSTTTLTWLILFLILHPDIQEECYQAIQENIGDRQPRLIDRNRLQIIDACILETLRLCPPASLGLPRSNQCDTEIGSYFIPKGTIIMANLYAMQRDPSQWEKPNDFNPRLHFIDESNQIRKPNSFMPFGNGRRVCIGEQLAKNQLFLAATFLLQKIKWKQVPGEKYNLEADPEINFAMLARSYSVVMEIRK